MQQARVVLLGLMYLHIGYSQCTIFALSLSPTFSTQKSWHKIGVFAILENFVVLYLYLDGYIL